MISKKIEVILGDITKLRVDAIVNAANSSLMGGDGVDGAIRRAAGEELYEECREILKIKKKCPTGQAVITGGGELPVKYVIHAVGPVWGNGKNQEGQLLAEAYINSMELAVRYGIKSIAFPNISTGIYGFPKKLAAEIAIAEVTEFLRTHNGIEKVIFCCYEDDNFSLYNRLLSDFN